MPREIIAFPKTLSRAANEKEPPTSGLETGIKASPCDLGHAKQVAPWGKPFGSEPPLQGSHVQKGITLDAATIRPNRL